MWRRLIWWLRAKLFGQPPMPMITAADLDALADPFYGPPTEGWFLWECEQWRRSGGLAFWFDPWRYPTCAPSAEELVTNYEASLSDALQHTAKQEVEQATAWVAEMPNLRERHSHHPDPIGWCLQAWRSAGKPENDVPTHWLKRQGYR